MDNSKAVMLSGAYGIPKWMMKKGMRYEVDDFIVSPPSHEDGEFLRLRYGRSPSPRPQYYSPVEAGGQDQGMTVEVRRKDSGTVASSPSSSTTITIGPGGFSVESSPLSIPDSDVESSSSHPLLVLPMNVGDTTITIKSSDTSDFTSSPAVKTEYSKPTATTTLKDPQSISGSVSPLKENTEEESFEKIKLVEKVQGLSVVLTQAVSHTESPINSPIPTPRASPLLGRKVTGVAMEPVKKSSVHSYFCTKQFQESQSSTSNQMGFEQDGGVGMAATTRAKQLEEGARVQQAIDPSKHFMGKRRQPKPSTLREMNFWAPTSM